MAHIDSDIWTLVAQSVALFEEVPGIWLPCFHLVLCALVCGKDRKSQLPAVAPWDNAILAIVGTNLLVALVPVFCLSSGKVTSTAGWNDYAKHTEKQRVTKMGEFEPSAAFGENNLVPPQRLGSWTVLNSEFHSVGAHTSVQQCSLAH